MCVFCQYSSQWDLFVQTVKVDGDTATLSCISTPPPVAPLYFHQQSLVHRGGLNLAAHHENQFTGETGMTEYISTTIINSHPTQLLWIYIYFSILFTVTLLLWAIRLKMGYGLKSRAHPLSGPELCWASALTRGAVKI